MKFLILSALVAVATAAPQYYPLGYEPFAPVPPFPATLGDLQAADINTRAFFQDQAQYSVDQARFAADLARAAAETKKFEEDLKTLKAETPKPVEPKTEEPKAEEPKAEEPKVEEPKVEVPKVEEPVKAAEPEKVAKPAKEAEKPFPTLKVASPWVAPVDPFAAYPAPLPYYQSAFPTPYFF